MNLRSLLPACESLAIPGKTCYSRANEDTGNKWESRSRDTGPGGPEQCPAQGLPQIPDVRDATHGLAESCVRLHMTLYI